MTLQIDPYQELGVPRDADEKTVRRAYRDRAKKVHPNAGAADDADPEAWARVSTALAVLTNPKRAGVPARPPGICPRCCGWRQQKPDLCGQFYDHLIPPGPAFSGNRSIDG